MRSLEFIIPTVTLIGAFVYSKIKSQYNVISASVDIEREAMKKQLHAKDLLA